MAKCIQVVGQGVPVRMSDADAFQVVERDHDGQYCPKSVWREFYAPKEDGDEMRSPVVAKLVGGNITETKTLHSVQQGKRYL